MMAMDVKLDPKSVAFLMEQTIKFPKEVRRAFLYAAGITLRIIRGRMNGKSSTIERWGDFTARIRAKDTRKSRQVFGGHLMTPKGKQLTMMGEGDRIRLGWIGPLEKAAVKFQEGGTEDTTKDWRRWCYMKGFTHGEVPTVAVTPERPVIAQTIAETAKHVSDWVLGAFDKILHKRIKSWEMRYAKSKSTKQGAAMAAHAADGLNAVARLANTMREVA